MEQTIKTPEQKTMTPEEKTKQHKETTSTLLKQLKNLVVEAKAKTYVMMEMDIYLARTMGTKRTVSMREAEELLEYLEADFVKISNMEQELSQI